MTLLTKALDLSTEIIEAAKTHPFNQALQNATLSKAIFAYYIEQDSLYLQKFAQSHAIIASKVSVEYIQHFLKYATSAYIEEQEGVHQFFKRNFNLKNSGKMTPATLNYTSYLLSTCAIEPVEVAIAAVLPCFWLYREIGLLMVNDVEANNPYIRWVEAYASDEFSRGVNEIITIFNTLGEQASNKVQEKMLNAFYHSTCLEWHFWNDAYHQRVFDAMNKF